MFVSNSHKTVDRFECHHAMGQSAPAQDRMRTQRELFALPPTIRPVGSMPDAGGVIVEPILPRPSDNATAHILKRFQREPAALLADILFSRRASASAPKRSILQHVDESLLDEARRRYDGKGASDPSLQPASFIAATLDVAEASHLGECTHASCSMNRLKYPSVRRHADALLTQYLRNRFGTSRPLSLAFVGSCTCFSEVAFLAQLRSRNMTCEHIALIDTQYLDLVKIAHDVSIEEEWEWGLRPEYIESAAKTLGQAAHIITANWPKATVRAFGKVVNYVNASQAGVVPPIDVTVSIDPGLDGMHTLNVRWAAATLQSYAARPGESGFFACIDAGFSLRITRPSAAPMLDVNTFFSRQRGPAYYCGRENEPGEEEAYAWLAHLEGPQLKKLDLRDEMPVWLQLGEIPKTVLRVAVLIEIGLAWILWQRHHAAQP